MTLLIAGISDDTAWMVADSVITGGTLGTREREHQIKILPSADDRALIGFAGDEHLGRRILELARGLPAARTTVDILLKEHCSTAVVRDGVKRQSSVDLAYAYRDDKAAHLVRIADGEAAELQTFHLGNTEAFEEFQRIRHRTEIDPVPHSFATFFSGSKGRQPAPKGLLSSTAAMLRLFFEWPVGDVGGFALPYFLTSEGAFLRAYGYSVSDPLLPQLEAGSIIPHGTAERGGFALSLTEWGTHEGLLAYWLQKPGGILFKRTSEGYSRIDIAGEPKDFLRAAADALGHPVEILFGDEPLLVPEKITIIRDKQGRPATAVAMRGRQMSMVALNVETEFRVEGLTEPDLSHLLEAPMKVTLDDGANTATVTLVDLEGTPVDHLRVGAEEVEKFIRIPGSARGRMNPSVAAEPIPHNVHVIEHAVVDPAWRTDRAPHPTLQGIMLRLRHPELGWVTFFLPEHEAKTLGEWLSGKSQRQE